MKHRFTFLVFLGCSLFLTGVSFAQMPMDMPLMHERMYSMMSGEMQMETAGQYSLDKMVENLRRIVFMTNKSNNEHQEIKVLLEMASELNLTEEQIGKLRQLNLEHQKIVIRKNAAALEAIMELENLLNLETPDKNKVSDKVIETLGAVADIYQNCLETNLGVKALLTKDQNKNLDTFSRVLKPKADMLPPPGMERMRQKRKEMKNIKDEMEQDE